MNNCDPLAPTDKLNGELQAPSGGDAPSELPRRIGRYRIDGIFGEGWIRNLGSTDEFPCFVVSTQIDGTSLGNRLKQIRLSLDQTVELVATVAEALHYAHEQRVVHRVVKPGNILLDGSGQPFVGDFCLPATDSLKIASVSIEHLGSRTRGQQLIPIAEHIDQSGADVIVLQEFNVTDTVADDMMTPFNESRRSESLDTAFAILNQKENIDLKYELSPNRTAGGTAQLAGVAWNATHIVRANFMLVFHSARG